MSQLIDKRRQQTRADIAECAVALFISNGFDATSMNDIAEAAGVSRRTAYRHFANKEDLVFEQPRLWHEVFQGALRQRQPDESTRDVVRRALMEVAQFIHKHRDAVLAAYSVLVSTPSLAARHGKSDRLWIHDCAALILADLGESPAASLQAAAAAGALTGATNALIAVWAAGQPHSDLLAMTAAVLDQVDSIWPAVCR